MAIICSDAAAALCSGPNADNPRSEPEPQFCNSGLAGYDATRCSGDRRFAIFVREVECGGAAAAGCAELHRKPCFSSRDTCGGCLDGFVGVGPLLPANRSAGDSNTACAVDPNWVGGRGRQLLLAGGAEPVCADAAELGMLRAEVEKKEAEIERLRQELARRDRLPE